MYAHIYKLPRNAGWQLLITTSPAINTGIVETLTYIDKAAAKAAAKRFNATAWNY